MKRAVIYARYSPGPNQTEQSIEGQIRECMKYAEQHDLRVIRTYIDRKVSGRTDNRREFQRMMEDSGKKIFDVIILYHTDRFARNRYDSAIYKHQLKQNGVELRYATADIPAGPEGIILESIMEGWAEYYSAELSRKIKRGMRESALKCHSTGAGRCLGYQTAEDKSLVIEPKGAKAVQTVFDMYIDGKSHVEICNYLNDLGFRTAQGKPFNKNSVNHIIRNKRYIGTYTYDDIVIEDGIPPIISKDTFQLAQLEAKRRKNSKRPNAPKAEYMLSGKAFCGHCKSPLVGVSGTGKTGNKWYYYYCQESRAKKGCTKRPVKRDWLEDLVVRKTIEEVLQQDVVDRIAQVCYEIQLKYREENSDVLFYEFKLAENRKAIKNTMAAIESGVVTKRLPLRLQELEEEEEKLKAELDFAKASDFIISPEQIEFLLWQFIDPLDDESWEDYKRRIIKCFVQSVFLYDDKLLIYYNVSRDGETRIQSDVELLEEALAGEFDQRSSGSTTREPDEPSVLHQREEPHRFAVRLFPFHLIASLSHEIKQHVDVLTDGAEIVSSAAPASIVPGAAAHLRQELFLPHQNGVSDPLVFLYKGFQLLIFFYDTDVGQVLREGTGIEPVRLRVKVQRRQRVQRLIGVPHIGMPVIFFRRLLEASYPILGLADRLIVVEQRLSIVTIELVGVRIAVCIVLVLEHLDALRPRGTVKPDAHRLRMGGQSCHDRQGQNPRCDRRNQFSSHDKTSFL